MAPSLSILETAPTHFLFVDSSALRRFAAAQKRTLDLLRLAHANAPFELAADRREFAYFDSVSVCAASTRRVSHDKAKIRAYCEVTIWVGSWSRLPRRRTRRKLTH
jgi:hypothetical protein